MNQQHPPTPTNNAGGSQFILDLRYLQHQSWQGSLQRLDTGERVNFRSALELIQLIEAAVSRQRVFTNDKGPLRNWKQEGRDRKKHQRNGTTNT
mgnify:CR=1 FL=1